MRFLNFARWRIVFVLINSLKSNFLIVESFHDLPKISIFHKLWRTPSRLGQLDPRLGPEIEQK